MFNFFRRSKTKEQINLNKTKNIIKNENLKVCVVDDCKTDVTSTKTKHICEDKNNITVAQHASIEPMHNDESDKTQRCIDTPLPYNLATSQSLTDCNMIYKKSTSQQQPMASLLLQLKQHRDAANNTPTPLSASTSTPANNPYVANICQLANYETATTRGGTLKEIIMVPAMGWRNKNKSNKKHKNKQVSEQSSSDTTKSNKKNDNVTSIANRIKENQLKNSANANQLMSKSIKNSSSSSSSTAAATAANKNDETILNNNNNERIVLSSPVKPPRAVENIKSIFSNDHQEQSTSSIIHTQPAAVTTHNNSTFEHCETTEIFLPNETLIESMGNQQTTTDKSIVEQSKTSENKVELKKTPPSAPPRNRTLSKGNIDVIPIVNGTTTTNNNDLVQHQSDKLNGNETNENLKAVNDVKSKLNDHIDTKTTTETNKNLVKSKCVEDDVKINNNLNKIADNKKIVKSETSVTTTTTATAPAPVVCSIAIPLPQKLLKSDKIPVTCSVNRNVCKSDTTKDQQLPEHQQTLANNIKEQNILETKNLVNQEQHFQTQINELKKQLATRDAEALKISSEMDELQRDVYVKSCGMDRLQAELVSANKESEHVRKRLKHLEDDLENFREKNSQLADELAKKSDEISKLNEQNEQQAKEIETKVQVLTERIQTLETQNDEFKTERDRLEQQRAKLEAEREEERKIVQETLEVAMQEKKTIQERWERDFEKLRTVNTGREQQLLDDFEWKLREVEQSCKRRLEEKDRAADEKIQQAQKSVEEKMKNAEAQLNEVLHLKSYEAEVKQLRGLTDDQQRSLRLMSQRTEELQLAEETLQEEIDKLKQQIECERKKINELQQHHEYELAEKERTLQLKTEKEKGDIAVQWEERMHQECSRLKTELEQMYNEEKLFAVEAVTKQKELELNQLKKDWEHRIEECLNEISNLKKELTKKDVYYQNELTNLQTKADFDILELRRSLDKNDMSYSDQIEKMTAEHEREIERLTDEYERKIKELEANWQMQIASTRTTLELVKEQMERDTQDKLQALDQHHRSQLEHQWEQLVQDKEEALQQMEQNYRGNCDKLKEEINHLQHVQHEKESELIKSIDNLNEQLGGKNEQISCLQNNVDTLQGGIHVLTREIKCHEQEIVKMQNANEKKIRRTRDELLAEQTRLLNQQKEAHLTEINKLQQSAKATIESLQKKCQYLAKLLEEMKMRYMQRQSREDDLKLIIELKQRLAKQDNELARITDERNYFKTLVEQKIPAEHRRKGGGNDNQILNDIQTINKTEENNVIVNDKKN